MEQLPIFNIRGEFMAALGRTNRIVLTAPTGSGKSTQAPQFLLDAPAGTLAAGQILVLQPRRLAARMLAERVADERAGKLGDEVGFQTRFETAVSAQTRLRFITEGILPRMLLGDPLLRSVAAVVFDEFHERSLATDLSLALIRSLQETRRPDLKLVVMSATLDAARLLEYLGNAPAPPAIGHLAAISPMTTDAMPGRNPIATPSHRHTAVPVVHLHAEGRRYPVDIRYRQGSGGAAQPWDLAADALGQLLAAGAAGDVLIFMPGSYEIRRTLEACRRHAGAGVTLLPLYGDLPAEQQHQVMRPDPVRRKIIVATNIAETSLTIPGVRHVIDSGLARIQRFDAARGFNTLFVETISRAAAEQRAGRAGREAPGICLRLWTQLEQNHRPPHQDAEIARVDLAETVLSLSMLGFRPHEFPWFESPPATAVAAATTLLVDLGALEKITNAERRVTNECDLKLDADSAACAMRNSPFAIPHTVTPTGRRMSQLPAHPRLARLLLEAENRGCLREATLLAAILSERNALLAGKTADAPAEDPYDSDLNRLMTLLHQARAAHYDPAHCTRLGLNATAARQIFRTQAYFHQVCHRRGMVGEEPAGT